MISTVVCMMLSLQLCVLEEKSRDVLKKYVDCYNMSTIGKNILELRVYGKALDKGKLITKSLSQNRFIAQFAEPAPP